jgi:hypothetical protein
MSKLSRRPRPRSSQGATRPLEGMRTVDPHAAGVDIGAPEILAGMPDGAAQQLVRLLDTYPAESARPGGRVYGSGSRDGRDGIHRRLLDAAG